MEEKLWIEKYRPKTVEDCILPSRIKKNLQQFVEHGDLPNLMLNGEPGGGKTAAAQALCEEIGYDYIIINASDESGIDVLRTKIRDFASTTSFSGNGKAVILDEADNLNPNSTQPALRGAIEEFSQNCRFIFTCNYKNKIIEPLHSRLALVEFIFKEDEHDSLMASFYKRMLDILEQEGVEYDKKVVAKVIKKMFPDFRKMINEFQNYGMSGCIDSGMLNAIADANIEELVEILKAKKFTDMRNWVAENADVDQTSLYRKLYDNLYNYFEKESIPYAVILLNDGLYESAFVADQEINTVATFTKIMHECNFKE